MRTLVLVGVILVGCGGAKRTATSRASTPAPGVSTHQHVPHLAGTMRYAEGAIAGMITHRTTHERLPGVVLVASPPTVTSVVFTAITDEDGLYSIPVPPGVHTVIAYAESDVLVLGTIDTVTASATSTPQR